MKTSVVPRSLLVLSLCAAIPACEDARRAIGYEKAPPDEFQIVQRAPLSIPPDFTLRPPAPGAVRPQEGATSDQAKSTLLGLAKTQSITTVGRDNSDIALLKRVGVNSARADIRELIDKEALAQANPEKGFVDKILFWQTPPKPGEGEVLSPQEEADRLRDKPAEKPPAPDDKPKSSSKSKSDKSKSGGGMWDWLPW